MELGMLPVSVKRVLCAAFCAAAASACAWPPLASRQRAEDNIVPASGPSSEMQPLRAATEQAMSGPARASTKLQRTAIELPQRGSGVRFIASSPEPKFLLGTTALSALGAGTVTAFQEGKTPALPTGTTVLHIGDSFAGALGIALREELAHYGVKSALRFQTATFIPTWAFHKKLPLYLLQHKPDLVVVTLGANELAIDDPSQRAGAIRRLVKQFADRPCVWIVPPLWRPENGLTKVIRDNCAPCRFMDTNALIREMPRVRDGIHPTPEARQDWARLVVAWLATRRDPKAARPWELRGE